MRASVLLGQLRRSISSHSRLAKKLSAMGLELALVIRIAHAAHRDEAQNLTPKQMKTLITRAGPGTKIVCLGILGADRHAVPDRGLERPDLCGRYRFKGWPHGGHVMLARGERSRLADFASDVL
jgi:hypothetical protein